MLAEHGICIGVVAQITNEQATIPEAGWVNINSQIWFSGFIGWGEATSVVRLVPCTCRGLFHLVRPPAGGQSQLTFSHM
jgi:hypothetical protein